MNIKYLVYVQGGAIAASYLLAGDLDHILKQYLTTEKLEEIFNDFNIKTTITKT